VAPLELEQIAQERADLERQLHDALNANKIDEKEINSLKR
jgi:hypothetical protein